MTRTEILAAFAWIHDHIEAAFAPDADKHNTDGRCLSGLPEATPR